MYNIEKITFSPRKIYWFEMPSSITSDIKIELLKKDILLIDCIGEIENIQKIINEKNEYTLYIFNLDKIILKNKDKIKIKCTIIRKIISLIEDSLYKIYKNSFVYTKSEDCEIDFYCNKAQIKHVTKDIFNNKKNILSNIYLYILPIFKNLKEQNREFLRLTFFPYILFEIEFPELKLKDSNPIKGYLKNLSFNGIAIILFNDNELTFFNTGTKIQLKIFFPEGKILINNVIIIRKLPEERMISINYDINNKIMISNENSNKLTELIFKYIKSYINLDFEYNISE